MSQGIYQAIPFRHGAPTHWFAHWPEPLTAPANQRTLEGHSRPGRPLKEGVRCAVRHPSIGDSTEYRPAESSPRITARYALIGSRCSGSLGLRVLAPLACADATNQRTFSPRLGINRPFHSSSRLPSVGLRANGTGDFIFFDLSNGVLGNLFRDSLNTFTRQTELSHLRGHFPGRNDRQECTFSRKKCGRVAGAHFPAAPARVRHASEGVTQFPKLHQSQPQ